MGRADLPGGLQVERAYRSRPDHLVARARVGTAPPVVVKASAMGARWSTRSALRREARLLAGLRHPGVVRLLEVVDGRHTVLVLEHLPGGHPAELDRQVAELVDDLRRLGVEHRAVTLDHVVLRADGTPALVGFGQASRRRRSSSVSRRTTTRAWPSRTNTTGGRGTLL
jgi:serine/threonine protein kinase